MRSLTGVAVKLYDILKKTIGGFFFFSGPVFGLLFPLLLPFFLGPLVATFGAIAPSEASRDQLVLWLLHRDLTRLDQETIHALADRYNTEFGRPSERRIVFAFSEIEKKLFARGSRDDASSRCTSNLDVLVKSWFFRNAHRYWDAPKEERRRILHACIADFAWWETVYFDFLNAVEQPIPNELQLALDYEKMIDRFCRDEDTETLRRVNRFRRELTFGLLARRFSPAHASTSVSNVDLSVDSDSISASGTSSILPLSSVKGFLPAILSIGQTAASLVANDAESKDAEPRDVPDGQPDRDPVARQE